MNNSFIIFLIILFCTSCTLNKSLSIVNLPKGTRLVKASGKTVNGERAYEAKVYQTNKKTDASIEIEDDDISIKIFNFNDLDLKETVRIPTDLDLKDDADYNLPYKLLYSESLSDNILDTTLLYSIEPHRGDEYFIGEKYSYTSSQFIFQPITIPFKFRSALNDLPYEVTTGINAGLASGIRWRSSSVKPIFQNTGKKMIA